jgi:hypothetical protein
VAHQIKVAEAISDLPPIKPKMHPYPISENNGAASPRKLKGEIYLITLFYFSH